MTVFNMTDRFEISGLQVAMLLQVLNAIEETPGETRLTTEREIIEDVLSKKVAA